MAKLTSWTCDVCGAEKREVNRWWSCRVFENGITVLRWNDAALLDGHLCGEQCVLKKVAEIMGSLGK